MDIESKSTSSLCQIEEMSILDMVCRGIAILQERNSWKALFRRTSVVASSKWLSFILLRSSCDTGLRVMVCLASTILSKAGELGAVEGLLGRGSW